MLEEQTDRPLDYPAEHRTAKSLPANRHYPPSGRVHQAASSPNAEIVLQRLACSLRLLTSRMTCVQLECSPRCTARVAKAPPRFLRV